MKRIGYLYEKIYDLDNCREAIRDAVRGKKKRGSVRKVRDNLEEYALMLHKLLKEETYEPSPYRAMTRKDASGKVREIRVPAFWPDRCVHHAVVRVVGPIISKSSYHWACGWEKGKGISRAKEGMERVTLGPNAMQEAKYCLQMDVKKFYPSIDRDRLMERFRRRIKDERALRLIGKIVYSWEAGLPLGNYTSGPFAHFLFREADDFVKNRLKAKYYIRYVDDMVILGRNKRRLHRMRERIDAFLRERLGLRLGRWQVYRVRRDDPGRKRKKDRPIDFLGYRFCRGYTTLRKRNALSLMRQSRKLKGKTERGENIPHRMAAGFIARTAQAKHCKSLGLREKYVNTIPIQQLKGVIRNESKRRHAAGGVQHRAPAGEAGLCLRAAV